MPAETRKRKAPTTYVEPESDSDSPTVAKKRRPAAKAKSAIAKVKDADANSNGSVSGARVEVGDTISLEGFGGTIETHDGSKTTLENIVKASDEGVILFTYPAAATPGCTKQACIFRDRYTEIHATGYEIYGLSHDLPKKNLGFKTKQNLPYTLLCDQKRTLINAIGLGKAGGKTARGVFVIDSAGKVLLAEGGSPTGTVDAVERLLGLMKP